MSRRFHCWSCKTAFLSDEPAAGQAVVCPKCGTRQGPPTAAATATGPAPSATSEPSVFVPTDPNRASRRRRWWMLALLALLTAAGAGLVVAWPAIKVWWHPKPPAPPDPIANAARGYLEALVEGDSARSRELGTVELPPAIRTFRKVVHDRSGDRVVKGPFGPIAAFHDEVDRTFAYDPSVRRFTPRNPLGPAAETLDALHEAKDQAEKSGLYKKMQSGDPDDLFDAAEELGKTMSGLASGVLAPKKLIPSYRQLVEEAKPPLPPAERELALDFGEHPADWDALLKRPFVTLRSDGPFVLETAHVTAQVVDTLGSLGDPPRTLHLTLKRFRLEGIDTGWKVTAARREGEAPPSPEPKTEPSPTPPTRSPGETTLSPGESGRP